MSTSKTYQQSLADAGSEARPPMLERVPKLQTTEDLQGDALLNYDAEIEQFKKLVNTSRAKKLEKSHDPLALVAHTGSSSRNTSSYYVTHPTSVVDYDDEYQHDDIQTNSEDPIASAMLLLARAITQNFSNPTNKRLRTTSNTKNQAIIQGDMVNIQSRNSGNTRRNNRRAYVQKEVVEGSNETGNVQRTLQNSSSGNTSTDEAGVILIDEQNDFLLADALRLEEIEDLSANICLMARIQPTNNTSDYGPSYDSAFISETSPDKQSGENPNKNVIAPGMYKVVTTQESQTNKAKNGLSSTGMNVASSVRRPVNRDSHDKNNVLANSKNSAKKIAVYVRKNKQTDNTSANVISNKENVIDVDVANASKVKTLLCVSFMQNVLIPCHDKCLANYKLNIHSIIIRTLSTNSRTPKSSNTTYVVLKTRFSKKLVQSKTLDTTSVVSKPKIDVGSASQAKNKVVQIVLWIVDSGCSKHKTGDRSLLRNFIEKFMGIVLFGNDNFAAIKGYGDHIQGNITIYHVYYVKGLGHNLFSLIRGRESNLYSISISDMSASSPVCLMSKATSTMSWLWHYRLSHLNFGTINDLTRLDLVDGLPKLKYGKDHLCSACERGKSKKASHRPKLVPSDHSKLELLHMDLYGSMRVASINGKNYILMIVDDYSRYTWVYFLHSKYETLETIKKFIAQAQLNYKAKVCKIRTDNGTEFKNATLKAHYEKLGIMQQFSTARMPQQNGVVKRRNRTLVEATEQCLSFLDYLNFFGLKQWLPLVLLKIDQSFIHDITKHRMSYYADEDRMLNIFMCLDHCVIQQITMMILEK
uniref:Integrase catalytic domain-containing protein n=1 Tax=Tanacetum cinerariifolium TaxID=118510 RepID=A0A699HBN2_TANCI|nr:hypothetical protein [Tanacetum cinerariifolium]